MSMLQCNALNTYLNKLYILKWILNFFYGIFMAQNVFFIVVMGFYYIPAILRMLFSPEEFLEHITDIATIICS